jgi:hypothetical protein
LAFVFSCVCACVRACVCARVRRPGKTNISYELPGAAHSGYAAYTRACVSSCVRAVYVCARARVSGVGSDLERMAASCRWRASPASNCEECQRLEII